VQLREALALAQVLEKESAEAATLPRLAPYLSETLMREALASHMYSEEALAGLAPRLAELGHPTEALALARALEQKDKRAKALARLLSHLPKTERSVILHEVLAAAWSDKFIFIPYELIPYLRELSHDTLYSLWRERLPIVAVRTRRALLQDLCALRPIIEVLGQDKAIAETWRAILDVGRWWP
jgi:hypothetical protein